MVPCNFIPSPDPECGPDANRRCRRPCRTAAAFGRTSCVSGRSRRTVIRPKLLEMVLRTANRVRSVCETGRHVAQSTIRCAFTR